MAYSAAQLDIARTIIAVGNSVGASRAQIKAALETGIVESNLSNPRGGTGTSSGWRQEISSYGSVGKRRNVAGAARRFYSEAANVRGSSGAIAAAVQRPAAQYRGRYAQVAGQAGALLRAVGAGGGSGNSPMGGFGGSAPTYGVQKGGPTTDLNSALIDALVSGRKNPVTGAIHAAESGAYTTMSQDKLIRQRQNGADAGGLVLSGARGSVHTAAGADRAGVSIKPVVLSFVSKIAGIFGQDLTIGTGTNHSRMTVDGNVSDHWDGHAADIPATGRRLIRLGQAALIAAGMDPSEARKQHGGLYNVGGHQVIFNTHQGGDHTNHLHVSAH
jgi:hypothetical protein